MEILYHPNKANVVVDALNRKRKYEIAATLTNMKMLVNEMRKLEIKVVTESIEVQLASLKLQPSLLD